MKVHIGPYSAWFGPYQLAEKLCFWAKPVTDAYGFKSKPKWVHTFGEWLAYGSIEPEQPPGSTIPLNRVRKHTFLYKLLLWLDNKKQRKVSIVIDKYDTWSLYATLASIILPALKQFREQVNSSPFIEDSIVPEYLRASAAPPKKDEYDIDDNHHKRWEWVLDEMIFAFENVLDDSWERQFESGRADYQFKKLENGCSEMVKGAAHTFRVDTIGKKAYSDRIQNGLELFGKFYQNLWG